MAEGTFKRKVNCAKINYTEEAKRIIDYNYDKNLKVDEIAVKLHLPVSYFSRIFKENEKISPKAYILNKKMERACELLRTENQSIAEVAYSVGFSDQLYFSRLFKNKIGMTPTAYMVNYF